MSIPPCVNLPALPAGKSITLPGGVTIGLVLAAGSQIPDPLDVVASLLGQASSAMAPLVPFFNLLDAVMALFDAVKAIPETFGPPPNPTKLIEALVEVAKKIAALAGLVPQLSLPKMLVDLLDALILLLQGLARQVGALSRQLERVREAEQLADDLGDANLAEIAACGRANVSRQLQAMNASLGPLAGLIGLINLFLGMLGQQGVPDLEGLLDADDPTEALEPLRQAITALTTIRTAIPLP